MSVLRGSGSPLVDAYDIALLDLDGVVFVGGLAVAHAADVLGLARGRGMRLAFVTNNARRTPQGVADLLTGIGVSAVPADVITSAQAAARLVARDVPPGAAVLVVGGEGVEAALREHGLFPVRSADDKPAAVIQGYAPDVDWRQLAEGAVAVARGVPWIASNLDRTIPSSRGRLPGNGALVEVIRSTTGVEPRVAGKPHPPLFREAMLRAGGRRPLVVGDRLDTDIEGASNIGADSLLVLTGVTSPAEVIVAPNGLRPTYLSADLRGLTFTHPPVIRESDGWRCGGWVARIAGDELCVGRAAGPGPRSGDGEVSTKDSPDADPGGSIDGLRAACAAAWSHGALLPLEVAEKAVKDLSL